MPNKVLSLNDWNIFNVSFVFQYKLHPLYNHLSISLSLISLYLGYYWLIWPANRDNQRIQRGFRKGKKHLKTAIVINIENHPIKKYSVKHWFQNNIKIKMADKTFQVLADKKRIDVVFAFSSSFDEEFCGGSFYF